MPQITALKMTMYFRKLFTLISSPTKWTYMILPVLLVLCFTFSTLVSAKISVGDFGQALGSPNYNKESFDFQSSYGLVSSMNTMIVGCQDESCPTSIKTGALHMIDNMIVGLYTSPPASGTVYALQMIDGFGVSDKAYAQTTGFGFQGLSPLLPLWKGFRNFSYVMFVFLFVLMGLAIMFRMKLNPQTVITIQSALPRIVVALLLVTFSYAIAGFVVDFIYIIIALMAIVFGQITGNVDKLQGDYLNAGAIGLFGRVFDAMPAKALLSGILGAIGLAGGAITGAIFFGGPAAWAATFVGGGLGLLLVLIFLVFIFIRIFFQLLSAYIAILMAVVFGPIQIALGVLPGVQQFGFGAWFRNLFANAMVFPAVAFMLMFAKAIQGSIGGANELWTPPLLFAGTGGLVPAMVGFGVLLITPQVAAVVKKSIGATELQFNVGAGWKEAGGEIAEGAAGAGYIGGKYALGKYAFKGGFTVGDAAKVPLPTLLWGAVRRKWGK